MKSFVHTLVLAALAIAPAAAQVPTAPLVPPGQLDAGELDQSRCFIYDGMDWKPLCTSTVVNGTGVIYSGGAFQLPIPAEIQITDGVSDEPSCPADIGEMRNGRCHVRILFSDPAGPISVVCLRRPKPDNGWVVFDCSWRPAVPPHAPSKKTTGGKKQ